MDIWVEGTRYSLGTMPSEVLALYLRKCIMIAWEDTRVPELNRDEGYAILKEAARRLEMPGRPMRNCDRFASGDEAFHAFDVECKLRRIRPCRAGKGMCTGHDSIHCFKDWLFAPCEAS